METSNSPHPEQPAVAAPDIQGRLFYPPGVIALYCALSVPMGLGLYGLNVARRGGRFMGYLLAGISGVLLLGMSVSAALGTGRSEFSLFPVVLGFGLYGMERCPYLAALRRGGLTAKWWPPLIWILGLWIVVAIMVTLAGADLGTERGVRGGSWIRTPWYARVAGRVFIPPGYPGAGRGFRLARSIP